MEKDSVKKACHSPRLLNEGPDVIGRMTSVLGRGGSLDTAVRDVALNGPELSKTIFGRIVEDADTRVAPDMASALYAIISSLPECNTAYGTALRLSMSAERSKTQKERSEILKEASEIALNGLRESGRTFCSSLNTPCMVIFGLGIMVPMVLMSVLPMMGMSGLFQSAMDTRMVSVVTLVLIPAAVISIIVAVSGKNPVKPQGKGFGYSGLVLLSAIPAAIAIYYQTGDAPLSICLGAGAGGIFTILADYRGRKGRGRTYAAERRLQDCIFEIGYRLMAGTGFEEALYGSTYDAKECRPYAVLFKNEMDICRGDVEQAIRSAFGTFSSETVRILTDIYRISLRDLTDAGKMAESLGRQLKDRESVRRSIRNELKSMTDTMYGTATVFAPLVLGLSVTILGPMRAMAGMADDGSTTLILSVYLVELCAIIAVLVSGLDTRNNGSTAAGRFACMMPVAAMVFMAMLHVSL